MMTPLLIVLFHTIILIGVIVVVDSYSLGGAKLKEVEYEVPALSPNALSPKEATNNPFGSDLGVSQTIHHTTYEEQAIIDRISEARTYINTVVMLNDTYKPVRDQCKNQHGDCAYWAVLGECQANPGYMKLKCAPVCHSCEQLQVETRCPLTPDAIDALYPGEMDKMFERITTHPHYQQYQPKIHSRPSYINGDKKETADYIIGPWLITFENVLSQEEADRMIELGGIEGYERSSDVGRKLADGSFDAYVNKGRTSTNAWCQDQCSKDPIAQRIMNRIENITGIPQTNSEALQLLRYETGQFYQAHSDYIPYQIDRQCGVRILTFYFYLNEVQEGGETYFPKLDIAVTPKVGRAALWPSVLNEDPNRKDYRTNHQAMPVISGVKYGANAWLHQRDFKTPNANGCA